MTTTEEATWELIARAMPVAPLALGMAIVDSPVGPVGIVGGEHAIHRVMLGVEPVLLEAFRARLADPGPLVLRAAGEVADYLEHRRDAFSVPVELSAVSPFQGAVLRETARVPRGSVATYAEIARRIGRPGAFRAVGTALGHNPVPLLVPCHRVLRAGGQLGEYSGGGPTTKRWLLELEGAVA